MGFSHFPFSVSLSSSSYPLPFSIFLFHSHFPHFFSIMWESENDSLPVPRDYVNGVPPSAKHALKTDGFELRGNSWYYRLTPFLFSYFVLFCFGNLLIWFHCVVLMFVIVFLFSPLFVLLLLLLLLL